MKSTKTTKAFATGFLALYSLWAVFTIGVIGFLMTASIGLLVFGATSTLEYAATATIVAGIAFLLAKRSLGTGSCNEGFEANGLGVIKPGGPPFETGGSQPLKRRAGEDCEATVPEGPLPILQRIAGATKSAEPLIQGFSSSSFVEGFADASSTDNPVPDAGSESKKNTPSASPSPAAPVPVQEATKTSDQLKKDLPAPEATGPNPATAPATNSRSEDNMLFRLGQIPTDTKNGPHIDAATTMMNALNALKPNQIEAMTNDTRKLLETQKNLMGMLETMKPMLQDGKQLIDSFGTLFGKA